jgi:hypothetical protein
MDSFVRIVPCVERKNIDRFLRTTSMRSGMQRKESFD